MLIEFKDMRPAVEEAAFIADNAAVSGNVVMGKDSSVWFGAAIRAEVDSVTIGNGSNIQDNATLHADYDYPVTIGDHVSVGHNAIVHGATIEDNVLIGMHATVLNGARIGKGSVIAAGALVKERTVIPENSLVVGIPGKIIRTLDEETKEHNLANSKIYIADAKEYAKSKVIG